MVKILCDLLDQEVEFSGDESCLSSTCPHFSSIIRCEKNSCGYPCIPATEYLEQTAHPKQALASAVQPYGCCAHH